MRWSAVSRDNKAFMACCAVALGPLILMMMTSCAPITQSWKASDFRGAYWCDCGKDPGNDTPDCYCRTLAPGVDYRKCILPGGAVVDP